MWVAITEAVAGAKKQLPGQPPTEGGGAGTNSLWNGSGSTVGSLLTGPVTATGMVQFTGTLTIPVSIDGKVIATVMRTGAWDVERTRKSRR